MEQTPASEENKVSVDKDGILQIHLYGDYSPDKFDNVINSIDSYAAAQRAAGKPVLILDNAAHMGKQPSEGRKKFADYTRTLNPDRLAIVSGESLLLRYTTNLVMKAIGLPNARFFDDDESALKWLKEFNK